MEKEVLETKEMVEMLVCHLTQAKDPGKEEDKFLQVEMVEIQVLVREVLYVSRNAIKQILKVLIHLSILASPVIQITKYVNAYNKICTSEHLTADIVSRHCLLMC